MTRLERLRAEGVELRRVARGLAYMLERIDKDIDRLTCVILRHEYRLLIGRNKKPTREAGPNIRPEAP